MNKWMHTRGPYETLGSIQAKLDVQVYAQQTWDIKPILI